MSRYTSPTYTYTLLLNCKHSVDHVEYVGVDPAESWAPGMGRWCRICQCNRQVAEVVYPEPAMWAEETAAIRWWPEELRRRARARANAEARKTPKGGAMRK